MDWIAGAIVLLSNHMKSSMDIRGWYLAVVANAMFLFINARAGLFGLCALSVINIFICIRGICVWRKNAR